jgi:hypothetical protein
MKAWEVTRDIARVKRTFKKKVWVPQEKMTSLKEQIAIKSLL